ncbi:uncharacterized protein J3R85_017298 [Psidium guajava]|nr:uncharacterized protein J3R85_017298 [Psidium guajava]
MLVWPPFQELFTYAPLLGVQQLNSGNMSCFGGSGPTLACFSLGRYNLGPLPSPASPPASLLLIEVR